MSRIESGDEVDVGEAVLLHENGEYVAVMWLDCRNVAAVWSRKCVRHEIRFPLDVSDIRRHFGDTRKLICLPLSKWVRFFMEGRYQRLLVSIDCKGPSFHHVSKMSDGAKHTQQLPIKWRPSLLVWALSRQLHAEVR